MARNQSYSLCRRLKLAVFTWHGCTVRVEGEPQVIYVSEETPMVMYLNSHIAIDQVRHRREQEGQTGPRVSPSPSLPPSHSLPPSSSLPHDPSHSLPPSLPLSGPHCCVCVQVLLAGATDVGKSTLCRLLLSYAARLGRRPCLVDCDVGQGSVSIPGTLCGYIPTT